MRRILLMALGMIGLGVAGLPAEAASDIPPLSPQDMVQGSDKAPVTVIEYASLDCPHCAQFTLKVMPEVKKDLIDTGKIRYVLRDFPLHKNALLAAQLAHCEPEKFWGFVEVLFQSQATWYALDDPKPELDKIAKLGGIAEPKFDACMDDKALQGTIVASEQGGSAAGINSTPTFFVNGKMHAGEVSYDQFVQLVHDAGS